MATELLSDRQTDEKYAMIFLSGERNIGPERDQGLHRVHGLQGHHEPRPADCRQSLVGSRLQGEFIFLEIN